jgi:hypothetical protein
VRLSVHAAFRRLVGRIELALRLNPNSRYLGLYGLRCRMRALEATRPPPRCAWPPRSVLGDLHRHCLLRPVRRTQLRRGDAVGRPSVSATFVGPPRAPPPPVWPDRLKPLGGAPSCAARSQYLAGLDRDPHADGLDSSGSTIWKASAARV